MVAQRSCPLGEGLIGEGGVFGAKIQSKLMLTPFLTPQIKKAAKLLIYKGD